MDLLFLLILCACASGVQGNYHYVIAPNVIRLESQEKVLVGILGGNRTQQLQIWFEYLDKQLLRQSVWIYSPETPVLVTFHVTANDLFANVSDEIKKQNKPKTIRLVCQDNFYNKQSQDIPLSFKSGYLIVQTDKPLYNPTQQVLVRVLAMDEDMKPVKNKYLEIDLINPSNTAVGRRLFQPGTSISGFYTCDFQLPTSPEIGTWTIKAKFKDMFETYSIAPIDIREFVLPTFGIHIQTTPSYILPTDDTVYVTITAMYVYGKAVDGTARLHFDIRREGDESNLKKIFTMSNVEQLRRSGKAHFTINIKKLKANKGGSFPAGGVLELSATVHESATGKEESQFDDFVKFVNAPFRFDLSRSKTTFQKGSIYLLQVYAFNVNGIKAANTMFNVEVYHANRMVHSLNRTTDSSGQSLDVFESGVLANPGNYTIKVFTPGFNNYGEQLQLQTYTGDTTNNIVVEKVDLEGHPFMRATTNIQKLNDYSGILFVVFARGKIVYHAYRPAAMQLSVPLTEDIIAKLAPVGRIVAFYVDKRTNTVVADSLSFYTESDQRKNKLKIEPAKQQVFSSDKTPFSIFGPSGMWVGFNVIDKALLLLNSDKTLTHDKLLKEMGNHDLGCGAGSGTTTEEILKNAGVTLLISSGTLNKDRLRRHSESCMGMKRRRRSLTEHQLASGRSVFDSQTQYQMDIDRLRDFSIHVRRRFDTSYFFEEKMISGSNFNLIKFGDSITEWTIQAIGISEDDGPYIADSKDVKTFRDFFVQVDLPYKATRKEMFNVKVTVCNYMKTEQTARVYLKGVDKLCYGTTPGQNSPPQTLTLPPNSAKSLSFGVIALEEGNYPITVSAMVVDENQPYSDIVEKRLYVVNEAIQERKTITVCLDPAYESKSCINSPGVTRHQPSFIGIRPSVTMTVDLTLPVSALRGSGLANAYLSTCSARNYTPEVNLDTRIESGDGQLVISYNLSNQNTVLNILVPMKVPNGDKLKVTVTGVGTGILKIDLFYSRLANKEEICPFEISRIKIKEVITEIADNQEIRLLDTPRPCDVCGYCPESEPVHGNISLPRRRQKRQVQEERPHLKCVEFSVRTKSPSSEVGMAIVEVNLETGVSVVESDLKLLQRNYTVFPLYEMPTDGKGFIIFYLSKVTSRPINIIFRLKDDFSGNEPTRQGASVLVYDYYNPEKSCIKQYSINPNKPYTVAMACEGGEQCKCVQSQCPQPVDDELFRMASALDKEQNDVKKRTLSNPIDKLMEYACNFKKANYVVYVTIMTIANDTQRNVRFASSTVKNVLLHGGHRTEVGDAMDFEWQTDCAHPAFEVGKTYYVIGKDISRLIDGDVERVRYDLMGTTLVINPMYKPLLRLIMNNFEAKLIKNKGCYN